MGIDENKLEALKVLMPGELISTFIMKNPPTKYIKTTKKKKIEVKIDKKTGKEIIKIKPDSVTYLTLNAFYAIPHWSTRTKVVNFSKDWLLLNLPKLPKMAKFGILITYHHHTDTFDLDNKCGFWAKMILDILKEPTEKQKNLAIKRRSPIKTLNLIKDDTVRYINPIYYDYKKGETAIEITIIGFKEEMQKTIF